MAVTEAAVVLTIAALHRLSPWRQAATRWRELLAGKHAWSSIGQQLGEGAGAMSDGAFSAQPRAAAIEFPPVTAALLDEVVRRVLAAGAPLTIVLFGSRARGDARPDSDLDLLIVEETDLPPPKRDARYYRALAGIFPAKDIQVWTPDEVAAWQRVSNSFIMTALREGRTLYAR